MSTSIKIFIPHPIRKIIRQLNKYPAFLYTRNAMRLFAMKLFKYQTKQYHKIELKENYSRYENLFRESINNFEKFIAPYISEFNWFIGRIYNGCFDSVEVELYYSMIRKYMPKLIIEIGSGHSTIFALDAIKRNRIGEIISIDPQPRRTLPKTIKQIKSKVEDVDLNLFINLKENDILFIDSSHTTEEAKYHIEKILPILKKGVIVHHHDFMFPYSVYHQNDPVTYGEPDILLDYYWQNQKLYEILVCASYVRYRDVNLIKGLIKSYDWNPTMLPSSLWTRKLA